MGVAIFVVGLVLGFACLGYFIYQIIQFCKSHVIGEDKLVIKGNTKKLFIGLVLAQGVFVIISSVGLMLLMHWNLNVGQYFMLIIGSYLFGCSFDVLIGAFGLYYYCPNFDEKQKKVCRISTFSVLPVIAGALILLTEGFAKFIDGPLPSGISFTEGLVYPGYNGFNIAFYGIILVTGAIVSYFVCDHYFYKKFKKHGLLDSLFVFAFICGIIGARLWFCLVLERDYYLAYPGEIFTGIVNGGLAIQGGALLGIIGGVSFVLLFRRYVDIRFAMDVAIPSILLAQVIGRWGNFFNQEVFGFAVSEQSLMWLPTIIRNNMYCFSDIDNQVLFRLPLFLIEGTINLGGYFVIRYLFGKVFKFKLGLGYQSSLYLVWYGMVRAILEPLRDGFTKTVGTSEAFGYMQSWITSFIMIGAGLLMLLIFFIIHKIRMNKGLEDKYGEKI